MRAAITALLLLTLAPAAARAAQVVALDVKPVGKVSADLARGITPALVGELGRYPDLIVVSQFEITALLEHESNKQAIGCDDTGCMTEIAAAMGAELMLASTLARVGSAWSVSLSLIETQTTRVIRRATGQSSGGAEKATDAAIDGVIKLMRDPLPPTVQGPNWMSERGFAAALRGLIRGALDPSVDANALRRKVVLDLVATELDFDADAKIKRLNEVTIDEHSRVRIGSLWAKSAQDLKRFETASAMWAAISKDLKRVGEIRTRARERGTLPSSRALRFERAGPSSRTIDAAKAKTYLSRAKLAHGAARAALKPLYAGDKPAFAKFWPQSRINYAQSRFNHREYRDDKKGRMQCEIAPGHALAPWFLKEQIASLEKKNEVTVILRCSVKGTPKRGEKILFGQDQGTWKITGWTHAY